MRQAFSVATLTVCLAHCVAITVIIGFDRAGNWRLHIPRGWPLAFMSPALIHLAGGLVCWGNRRLSRDWLVVAVLLSALVVFGVYSDHSEWRRTQPGREVQLMGAFLAMLFAWAVGLLLLVVFAIRRLLSVRPRPAEPVAAPGTGRM